MNRQISNRSRWARVTAATLLAALTASPVIAGFSTPAQAATSSSNTKYQCAAGPDGLADEALLTLSLKVPESVSPGEEVALKGKAKMTFGPTHSTLTRLSLADTATLTSSNLYVVLAAGSGERELGINNLKSKPASTSDDAYTATAPLTLPRFIVPEDASEVSLRAPNRAATGNPAGNKPANVVFTVKVTPNGGIGGARNYGCWLAEGQEASTIARIPVNGTSGPKSKSKKSDGGIMVPEDPVPGSATGRTPTSSAPADEAPKGDVSAPPSADNVPVAAQSGTTQKPFAAIPPNTKIGGLIVPTWALLFFAAVTPLAIAAFITVARRRLQLLAKVKGL